MAVYYIGVVGTSKSNCCLGTFCGPGSGGLCCSGSDGLCCSGSDGLRTSALAATDSWVLMATKYPNVTPNAKSPIIVIALFGVFVMVIWIFVPLVKGPSGDEMLSSSRSFSGSLMSIN